MYIQQTAGLLFKHRPPAGGLQTRRSEWQRAAARDHLPPRRRRRFRHFKYSGPTCPSRPCVAISDGWRGGGVISVTLKRRRDPTGESHPTQGNGQKLTMSDLRNPLAPSSGTIRGGTCVDQNEPRETIRGVWSLLKRGKTQQRPPTEMSARSFLAVNFTLYR